MTTVAAQVTEARARLGWSQERLAREAGVAANTVVSVERGSHRTQARKLAAIRTALGLAGPSLSLPLGDLPPDVRAFLRVAVRELSGLSEAERTRRMVRMFPMLAEGLEAP